MRMWPLKRTEIRLWMAVELTWVNTEGRVMEVPEGLPNTVDLIRIPLKLCLLLKPRRVNTVKETKCINSRIISAKKQMQQMRKRQREMEVCLCLAGCSVPPGC